MTGMKCTSAHPPVAFPPVTTSPEDNAAPVPPSEEVRRAQERAESLAQSRRARRMHYAVPIGLAVLSVASVWFNVLYGDSRWINGAIATVWVLYAVRIVTTGRVDAYETGYTQGSALAIGFATAGMLPPIVIPHYSQSRHVDRIINEMVDGFRAASPRHREAEDDA